MAAIELIVPKGVAIVESVIDFATSGSHTIITPAATSKLHVLGLVLVAAGAVTVNIKGGTTSKTGAMSFITGVPLVIAPRFAGEMVYVPLWSFAAGEILDITTGGAVQLSGSVWTYEKPAN